MNIDQIYLLASDAGKYYYLPKRFYHTIEHAKTVAENTILINGSFDSALYIAGRFHDAVYVPSSFGDSNEQCSAALMMYESKKYSIDSGIISDAYQLINRTSIRNHLSTNNSFCGCDEFNNKVATILDADLSSLANSFVKFKNQQDLIIRENLGNIETDRPKCADFLRDLANCRKFIYHTPYGQEHWEAKARQNISDYVKLVLK